MIEQIGKDLKPEELKKKIDRFSKTHILVLGDIILDRFIWGDVSRISPEAPVPVVDVKHETEMLGGAANVVSNISSLGGRSAMCGVIGNDNIGSRIKALFNGLSSVSDGTVIEEKRPSSIKTRIVAHNQQVVRFDKETKKEIGAESIKGLLSYIKKELENIDAIIVADYGKGVISPDLMKGVRDLIQGSSIILGVDPKTDNFESYHGVDVITPNHYEAGAYCGFDIIDEDSLIRAGNLMLEKLNCRSVLITQGKDGMSLFDKDGRIGHIPTVARKVFDVTGAGDTVISTLCLGLASGMDRESAAMISNFAAGIVVGEVGTSTVSADSLKKAIHENLC